MSESTFPTITIKSTGEVEEEIELTPIYCFGKAAEALLNTTPGVHDGYCYRDPAGKVVYPLADYSDAWRKLGEAIQYASTD